MIFVTGDTHGDTDFDKLSKFDKSRNDLTKNDYMIILGDFGAVWDEATLDETLKPYRDLSFTVLFIDGNHENFDLIDSFPVEYKFGGKTHIIRPDVIHLMRGQVFEIENKTFFSMGGATSIDKTIRIAFGLGWWKQECPTFAEMSEGVANLSKYNNKVDYILSHACGERALYYPPLCQKNITRYRENIILSNFENTIEYDHWYFGHYHEDADLNDKMTILYQTIRQIV